MKITRPSSFQSHRALRHGVITALSTLAIGAAMSLSSVSAQTIYVGGDAAEGLNVSFTGQNLGTNATAVDTLPIAVYTAPGAETIDVTQVNFFSSATSGAVTPFLAIYSGTTTGLSANSDTSLGANYDVIAIGDALSVTSNGLQNDSFTVGGFSPSLTLASGAVLVAGFYDTNNNDVGQLPGSDPGQAYLGFNPNHDTLPASAPGNLLNANLTGGQDDAFNVGFTVEAAVPEPSSTALMFAGLLVLAVSFRRGLRAKA
jgi:hypothetical protein